MKFGKFRLRTKRRPNSMRSLPCFTEGIDRLEISEQPVRLHAENLKAEQ